MNEQRPTPETDAEANNMSLCDMCVPADFARSLERQRDELLEALEWFVRLHRDGHAPAGALENAIIAIANAGKGTK